MAAYPSSLPLPLVEGYTLSPVEQVIRTDMETGAARVRRRTRARNDVIDVGFVYTPEQFATFRAWFEDDATGIAGGSSWFDMAVDIGTGGISTEEVRFKGAWKASRDGRLWRITAQIEVR